MEVLEARTENTRTYAKPDGDWLTHVQQAPSAVLVAGDGSQLSDWAAPDNTLVLGPDGKVRPAVGVGDVWLSGGSATPGPIAYSRASEEAVPFTFLWGGEIPAPTLDGARAIYADVYPGVDFVLDVGINGGLQQYFVLRTPAALAYADQLSFAVQVPDAAVELTDDGGFSFVDAEGTELAHFPTARAWDATADALQPRPVLAPWDREINLSPGVDWDIPLIGDAIEHATAGNVMPEEVVVPLDVAMSGDVATLALQPDTAWASSPQRTFPLVFDPDLGVGATWYDGYVRWDKPTTSYLSTDELFVGTANAGGAAYFTYINFQNDIVGFEGEDITDAKLKVYNHHSWSCTASKWKLFESDNTSADVTFNKFLNTGDKRTFIDEFSHAKGHSSGCPDGFISAHSDRVTAMVQGWADSSDDKRGVWLMADDNMDNYSWKRFYSRDYWDSTKRPYIEFTRNKAPKTPTDLMVDGTADAGAQSLGPISTNFVTVSAVVEDADGEGGRVRASFDIFEVLPYAPDTASDVLVVSGVPGSWVTTGSGASSVDIARFLQKGATYRIVVWSDDGGRRSKESLEADNTFKYTFGGTTTLDVPAICDDYDAETILPTPFTPAPALPGADPCVTAWKVES